MNKNFSHRAIHLSLVSALALSGAGFALSSFAATSAADLGVSAQILDACTITATPVNFGDYDHTAGSDKAASGSVTETCTNGTAAFITLGEGLNAKLASVPGVPLRQMASGANRMAYFLYQDSGEATLWGNTQATGVAQVGTGNAGTTLTVYGYATAGQNVPVGSYSDTVVATVNF